MFRNSLILIGAAQVLILLVGLGRAKALAVLAGPSGLGVIATIDQLIVTLTQFGALGLPYTALKFMSAAHSRSADAFRGAYAAYMRVMIVLALATALGVFVLFSLRPGVFGAEAARYGSEIQFALLGVAPIMVTFLLAQTFAAAQKPVQAALFNLASVGALAVAAVAGLIMTNLAGLYAATAATGFVIAAGAIIYLQKAENLSLFSAGASIRRELASDPNVVNTAMSVYVTLVGYAACLLVVRYALFDTVGEAATGLLQSALAAALSFGAVISAMVNLSLAPALNRDGSDAAKIATANVFAGKILLLLFLGAIPVALFPRTVLTLLYTGEFAPAAMALTLCIVWQCSHQIMAVYQQLLVGLNQVRYMAFCAVAGFALSGALAFILVPAMGQYGADLRAARIRQPVSRAMALDAARGVRRRSRSGRRISVQPGFGMDVHGPRLARRLWRCGVRRALVSHGGRRARPHPLGAEIAAWSYALAASPITRRRFAGTPVQISFGGTTPRTTLPAPITELSPTRVPGRRTLPAPTQTLSPMTTPVRRSSQREWMRISPGRIS